MLQLLPVVRSIAALLLVGNLLIIAHEGGHYLAARFLGVRTSRFVIGFGPTLWQARDRHGTAWSLALLPIGGFVGFADGSDADNRGSYAERPPIQRMAIIAAGPFANILAAIAVFAVMFATAGMPAFLPTASTVVPGTAAARAGFQPGDRILDLNGTPVTTFDDLRPTLRANPGRTINVRLTRNGRVVDLFPELGTTLDGGKKIGMLGIVSTAPMRIPVNPAEALTRGAKKTWATVTDTLTDLAGVITRGRGAENFIGIVGVAQITGQAAGQGATTLMALVGILSTNLALMNLLPIPVLGVCPGNQLRCRWAAAILGEA
jgi:regulator of sigma E protease